MAQQTEEALHVREVRRLRRHLHPTAVRHPLNLVQDVAAAALVCEIVEEVLEGSQVERLVVHFRRRRAAHEHQPGMPRQAALNVAVDAPRLHDWLRDVVVEDIFRGLAALGARRAQVRSENRHREQGYSQHLAKSFQASGPPPLWVGGR